MRDRELQQRITRRRFEDGGRGALPTLIPSARDLAVVA
jgi:hypothetical protein